MSWSPEASYARSGDVHIAYQAVGEGPDLVLDYGWLTHFESLWEDLQFASFVERLSSFSRVILFDRRGHGLSDPIDTGRGALLEQRMDDVRAVMEAAGSEQAFLMGTDVGGRMAALFAATHPDRALGLVLYGSMARIGASPDYPFGLAPEAFESFVELVDRTWLDGSTLELLGPSRANDAEYRRWWGRYQRSAMSAGEMVGLLRQDWQDDVRGVLPTIAVPTLVLHRAGDLLVAVDHGRYLAEHIPGAGYVELEGDDHLPWFGDAAAVVEEVQEFVTGARGSPEPDRVLVTVLFTDIVTSTSMAVELGDARWRALLDRHDALVNRQIERFRGVAVKTTGDGFLAAFDGPGRAVRCALAIREGLARLGLDIRAGVHIGECERRGEDLSGIAVHVAARVMSIAGPGQILASATVRDLTTGSGLQYQPEGTHQLKGVPGDWPLFSVAGYG